MHPDATTVLDLKAFYFLEQAIPDVQRELLPAYPQKVYHQTSKYWNGGISSAGRTTTLGSSLPASPAVPAIIRSCWKYS